MAKRRLTRRQSWRIEKVQQERLARFGRNCERGERLLNDGNLGVEQEGLVVANHGANISVRDQDQQIVRTFVRSNLELPVAGDRIVWRRSPDGGGVIVGLLPRRSLLSRPDPSGNPHPLAANVDLMVIVGAPQPNIDLNLLDRYLVAAETLDIRPAILVNKDDLLNAKQREALEQSLAVYARVGYATLFASAKRTHGLDDLKHHLQHRTSVLVGQSGVGKSSIINHLLPMQPALEGELTRGLGRHTTSTTSLYQLPSGGQLIDSPGVRRFSLWHLPPLAVGEGFAELRPLLGHCRFRDCRHLLEPGCALRSAMESGKVDPRRLSSYHQIIADSGGQPKTR